MKITQTVGRHDGSGMHRSTRGFSSSWPQKIASTPITLGNYDLRMQEYSRQLLLAALAHCNGNRTKAIELLELPRGRFYRIAKSHRMIEPDDQAPDDGFEGEDKF